MKRQSHKVIAINIAVTFVEGFAAAWVLTGNSLSEQALVGAGAAGVSLVWNTIVKPWLKDRKFLYN